ncbi:MAG: phage terminase small subunit-related protein [Lachnospiraceae bacterium]|nr:phage terminase small subunit-related protein [Lachnospiraceae bacterium]
MARARSPDSIKAEELYRTGMKLVEIAKKLGVPASTVRRWKSTQDWDGKGKKKENERSKIGKTSARKREAPKGNQNHLIHGGYSHYKGFISDQLDEVEKAFLESGEESEEQLLIDEIAVCSIRERKLMKAIQQYRDAEDGVYMSESVRQEQKRTFKDDAEKDLYEERLKEKVENGSRLPGEMYSIQTQKSAAIDVIIRLEKELTTVQSKKIKAIETLSRIRVEKAKLENEASGNILVDDWLFGVVGDDEDGAD